MNGAAFNGIWLIEEFLTSKCKLYPEFSEILFNLIFLPFFFLVEWFAFRYRSNFYIFWNLFLEISVLFVPVFKLSEFLVEWKEPSDFGRAKKSALNSELSVQHRCKNSYRVYGLGAFAINSFCRLLEQRSVIKLSAFSFLKSNYLQHYTQSAKAFHKLLAVLSQLIHMKHYAC